MGWFTVDFGPALYVVVAAVFVAGVVRGFSGFGTAMIVGPATAAAYSPQTAVVVIMIIDTLPMLPLVVPALKKVEAREIAPVVAGYALALPLGIWFLKTGDTTLLRWFMSAIIFIVVVVLWSGWYYRGPRTVPVRLGVGGMSGFLGGSTSVLGPPVILYWMAMRTGAGFVRANLMVYLTVAEVFAFVGLFVGGLLTGPAVSLGIICSPFYLIGLLIGAGLFGTASEATYKRVALAIVLAAAVLAMPALDGLRG